MRRRIVRLLAQSLGCFERLAVGYFDDFAATIGRDRIVSGTRSELLKPDDADVGSKPL